MITKEQALTLHYGQTFHYGECKRAVGPRGGITESTVNVRASGRCQTWKTRPTEFRLPIKHGLYTNGEVTERNASEFHLVSDCPLTNEQAARDQALDSVCGAGTAAGLRSKL